MAKKSENMYYRARMHGAEINPLYSNKLRAAEDLFVSEGSLENYESDNPMRQQVPQCDIVARMVEIYHCPDLANGHIRENCPLMAEIAAGSCSELSQAACGWMMSFETGQGVVRQFAAIARDGLITEDEVEVAQEIRRRATEIAQTMNEVTTAIDKAMLPHKRRERP